MTRFIQFRVYSALMLVALLIALLAINPSTLFAQATWIPTKMDCLIFTKPSST